MQLIAVGPGADSAATVMFIISSWAIRRFFPTQVFSINAIMAHPPTKVNDPAFAKVRKRFGKNVNFADFAAIYSP